MSVAKPIRRLSFHHLQLRMIGLSLSDWSICSCWPNRWPLVRHHPLVRFHLFSQSLQDGLWHTFQSSRWHFLRDEIRSTNHPFYKGFCHIYKVKEHRSLPLIHLLFIWISVSTWRCSSAATTFFRAMCLLIPRLPFGWGQESMKPVCESERERMEKGEASTGAN